MKRKNLILAFLTLLISSTFAQKGIDSGTKYGIGEDSIRCRMNLSLYDQDYRQKRLIEAFDPWYIAFNECPLSTINLYTHGTKIVAEQLDQTIDKEKRAELYQLLLRVYDQRAKYFGENSKYPIPYIMGLKALDMLKYMPNDTETSQKAYQLLKDNLTKAPTTAQPAIIAQLMNSSISMYEKKVISNNEVIDNYNLCVNWTDSVISSETKPEKQEDLKTLKSNLNAVFTSSGIANCENLIAIISPSFESKKNDVNWLKNSNAILSSRGCNDAEIFSSISVALYNIEPSPTAAENIARMYLKKKDFSTAKTYYEKAVDLETNPTNKSKYLFQLGLVIYAQGDLVNAKSKTIQAISLNNNYGDPYILLGKIYASAAKNYGKNEFDHKTVYWVSVDKFQKAKEIDPKLTGDANELIALYSEHFPTQEEVFFQGLKVGDSFAIEDWINEKTSVRVRK